MLYASPLTVFFTPFPLVSRIALALNFELLRMPVAVTHDGRIVEFLYDVVTRRSNIEVQTPIDVVRMDVAGASILCPCEPKPWADRPVRVQPPLRDVPIPACLHLAYENDFGSVYIDCHAGEVPRVGAAVDD